VPLEYFALHGKSRRAAREKVGGAPAAAPEVSQIIQLHILIVCHAVFNLRHLLFAVDVESQERV
jgi:hypothetical protein